MISTPGYHGQPLRVLAAALHQALFPCRKYSLAIGVKDSCLGSACGLLPMVCCLEMNAAFTTCLKRGISTT